MWSFALPTTGGFNSVAIRLSQQASAKGGRTPAHIACAKGHTASLQVLVDCGANVNRASNGGRTPAHTACSKGHAECLRVLLSRPGLVDLNMPANDGQTPAHLAAQYGHANCIEVLAELKANLNKKCNVRLPPPRALVSSCASFGHSLLLEPERATPHHGVQSNPIRTRLPSGPPLAPCRRAVGPQSM